MEVEVVARGVAVTAEDVAMLTTPEPNLQNPDPPQHETGPRNLNAREMQGLGCRAVH